MPADFPDYINTWDFFFLKAGLLKNCNSDSAIQLLYKLSYSSKVVFQIFKRPESSCSLSSHFTGEKMRPKKASGGKVMIYLGKTQIYLSKQHSITTHICAGIFKGEFVVTLYEGILNLTDICISVIREQHIT